MTWLHSKLCTVSCKILAFLDFAGPWEKMASDGPKWVQEDFFLLIQTLPTFWAERICILRFVFCFFGSQISGIPGPQISKFPDRGLGQAWADLDLLEHSSAVAPRWLRGGSRTTKLVRSKELGQYRENPISASPVWGICSDSIVLIL